MIALQCCVSLLHSEVNNLCVCVCVCTYICPHLEKRMNELHISLNDWASLVA